MDGMDRDPAEVIVVTGSSGFIGRASADGFIPSAFVMFGLNRRP